MAEFDAFRRDVHSQNGEDGVLAEILRRLDIPRGWFCEFGAWDGEHLSNTRLLLDQGWSGVMIEGERTRYRSLQQLAHRYPLTTVRSWVSPSGRRSLDRILARTPIPRRFEVLSVDVDGADLPIFRGVRSFRPRVVILEIDSSYPPGIEWDHPTRHASFTVACREFRARGYTPVAHTGNLFAVEDEDVPRLGIPDQELADDSLLFDWRWIEQTSGHE